MSAKQPSPATTGETYVSDCACFLFLSLVALLACLLVSAAAFGVYALYFSPFSWSGVAKAIGIEQ
jgi:hypothetical protein